MKALPFVLLLSSASCVAQTAIRTGDPLRVTVTLVRSIYPEERIGFSKSVPTYHVEASTKTTSYIAYCSQQVPQAGSDYIALDEYVSKDYSLFRVSPIERRELTSEGKGSERLYRVLIFQNARAGKYPDVACDLGSVKQKAE